MRQGNGGEVVNITFHGNAFSQLHQWEKEDKKVFDKISRLIIETARDPFHGTGKPEPLKGNLAGHWSRIGWFIKFFPIMSLLSPANTITIDRPINDNTIGVFHAMKLR